jgi:hypothetical protein
VDNVPIRKTFKRLPGPTCLHIRPPFLEALLFFIHHKIT